MKIARDLKIAVLILAQNEASVIAETITSISRALGAADEIFVIADNCTDDTVIVAEAAGAQVLTRDDQPSTNKGLAIAWFLEHFQLHYSTFDFLLVLDADSRIDPTYLDSIRENIPGTGKAFQSLIVPDYDNQSPIGNLAALSYLLDQQIADGMRLMLGWSVRLRGTGMLIAPDVLFEIRDQLDTAVEDIALSLLIFSRDIQIGRIEQAVVYDPVPDSAAAASRQRARWFRGQWSAAWQYRKEIASALKKGPRGWSFLFSLFLKPRWLFLTISLILALVLSRWWWAAIFFWGIVLTGALYLTVGMLVVPERKTFILALFYLPAYVAMWIRSIILSLRSSSWLKARGK